MDASNGLRGLRALRERRGYSQDGLAVKAGVHRATVNRIEQGRGTTAETLRHLAEALGVGIHWTALVMPNQSVVCDTIEEVDDLTGGNYVGCGDPEALEAFERYLAMLTDEERAEMVAAMKQRATALEGVNV